MSTSFQTTIPDQTYAVLKARGRHKDQLAADARCALAAHYFQDRTLSLGQAAELASLNMWDFTEYLSRSGISIIDFSEEEIEEEFTSVDNLLEQLG